MERVYNVAFPNLDVHDTLELHSSGRETRYIAFNVVGAALE